MANPLVDSSLPAQEQALSDSDLQELTRTLSQLEVALRQRAEPRKESDENASPEDENSRFCNDEGIRTAFIKEKLRPLRKTPEKIADTVYKGLWGAHRRDDPGKSSWRVREANRYITEIYRQRELNPLRYSIVLGLLAVAVAILAVPWGDSVFAQLRHLLAR